MTELNICKARTYAPMIEFGHIKHPFGKPDTIHVLEARMYIHAGYLSSKGHGFNECIVNDINIFFQNKTIRGSISLNAKDGKQLYESLKKIYDTKPNGICKKIYAGLPITKYRRYQTTKHSIGSGDKK